MGATLYRKSSLNEVREASLQILGQGQSRQNATNVQRPRKENISRNKSSNDFPLQTYHDLQDIICLGGCSATYSEQED